MPFYRQLQCQLRTKEKSLFNRQGGHRSGEDFKDAIDALEAEIQDLKELVGWKSEELDMRLRCLREFQISQNQTHSVHYSENTAELRYNHVNQSQ